MKARIYKPCKTAMQSGKGNTKSWQLVYEADPKKTFIEPVMGWMTSSDMQQQIMLSFVSKEAAIDYAKKQKIDYTVEDPNEATPIYKSYAENFTD